MSSRNKTLVLVFLAGVLFLVILRTRPKPNPSEAPAPRPSASAPSSPTPAGQPREAALPEKPHADPQQLAREQANLAEVDVVRDERGATSISINLKMSSVCFPGDLDVLQKVFAKGESLIFSAEPMDTSLGKGFTRTISPDEIRKGLSFRAPISLEKVGVWSLSLCGDKAGKRSCLDKKPVDFNKAFAGQEPEAVNALYYFQFAVLGKKLSSVYTGLVEGGRALKNHLKEKEGLSDAGLHKQIDKAFHLMDAIKSVPPYTSRSGDILWIEIPVAGLDPLACRN